MHPALDDAAGPAGLLLIALLAAAWGLRWGETRRRAWLRARHRRALVSIRRPPAWARRLGRAL